jgi:signal transduction histidine kinase
MEDYKPLNILRNYLDHLIEGCIITNKSGDVEYMNKQAAKHFRINEQGIVGNKLSGLLSHFGNNDLEASVNECLEKRETLQLEQQVLFSDEDVVSFKFRVEPVPDGIMLLSVDITPQTRAEELYRVKDEEYHRGLDELNAVINALPGIVSVVDTNFRVLHANKAAYETFGQSSFKEILGKTCYSVRKGFKVPCAQCNLVKAFEDGKVKVRLSTPEEEKMLGFSTKAYAIPLFDKNGKLWGGVEVIMDVDDIRKAGVELEKLNSELHEKNDALLQTNRELKEAKQKAEESDRLKSAFLANMSHEFRTPMNSIMGFASLLSDEDSLDIISKYAKIIVDNSEQLVSIIDGIVLYSKIQTEMFSYNPSLFKAGQLLDEVQKSFNTPEFQKKGIALKYECGIEKDAIMETDQAKLKQIITSLVSNAIKYTHEGVVTVGCSKAKSDYRFYVKDTGIGIPEKDLPHIFERFYRGSNFDEASTRGTGLGLSITKELSEKLGGSITVESEPDKGSTFYLTIPREKRANEKK